MTNPPATGRSTTQDQTFPECVPVLTDGRVVLRGHRESDAGRIVEQCLDPESTRWTTVPLDYTEAMAQKYLAEIAADWSRDGAPRSWAIAASEDPDTFLGSIDVRPVGAGIAALGFGLHPEGRGRGLMAAAVRLATQWWFDQGGVRLWWSAFRGNIASWRVAHACGFTFHGILPQHQNRRGTPLDEYTASIGREDDPFTPRTPWPEPVVLEAGPVRLRPWRDDDRAHVPESDSTPAHFLPPGNLPTRDTFEDWLLARRERGMTGRAVSWCLADARSDTPLGNVVVILDRHEPHTAELGYFLFESARGRGLATVGAWLAATHALQSRDDGGLGVERLVAVTVGDNQPSARVLERLGFRAWGREPGAYARADGSLDDARHWLAHGISNGDQN